MSSRFATSCSLCLGSRQCPRPSSRPVPDTLNFWLAISIPKDGTLTRRSVWWRTAIVVAAFLRWLIRILTWASLLSLFLSCSRHFHATRIHGEEGQIQPNCSEPVGSTTFRVDAVKHEHVKLAKELYLRSNTGRISRKRTLAQQSRSQ